MQFQALISIPCLPETAFTNAPWIDQEFDNFRNVALRRSSFPKNVNLRKPHYSYSTLRAGECLPKKNEIKHIRKCRTKLNPSTIRSKSMTNKLTSFKKTSKNTLGNHPTIQINPLNSHPNRWKCCWKSMPEKGMPKWCQNGSPMWVRRLPLGNYFPFKHF